MGLLSRLPVVGFEGVYDVTCEGEIYRIKPAQGTQTGLLKTSNEVGGYTKVRLCVGGKTSLHFVHRLVAEAFIPNPENKPCVNHKDGNKQNNKTANLEWVTYSENMFHSMSIGLHPKGENHYTRRLKRK